MFHKLAPSNADDVDHSKRYVLASWRNAHEFALVGAPPSHTQYHLIAFGDHVVYRGFEIWECAAYGGSQLFDAFTTRRHSGGQFFVFNEVGRQELVGLTDVSPDEDFLHHVTD